MKSATSKHPWLNVFFAILVMGTLTAGCAAHQPRSPGQNGYGQLAAEPPHQILEQTKKAARPGPPPFVEHMAPLSKAVVQDDKLYSLAFENARLGEVITALTHDADFNLSIESEIDLATPVTVQLRDVTLEEALGL